MHYFKLKALSSHLVIFNTAAVLLLPYRWQSTTTYQEEEETLSLSAISSFMFKIADDFRSELIKVL